MTIQIAQSAQLLLDQVVDRIAGGEQELLTTDGQCPIGESMLQKAIIASAVAAKEAGEQTEKWQKRQMKRLKSKYHELIDSAVDQARSSSPGRLRELMDELDDMGICGLSSNIDPLSKDAWTDVPSMIPLHEAKFTWAGVGNTQTRPKLLSEQPEILSCDVDIKLLLGPEQRGAHMSRMQLALLTADEENHKDLDEYALAIALATATDQPNIGVQIRLNAEVRFRTVTRKTGLPSFVRGKVGLEIELDSVKSVCRSTRILNVDIATACPCTMRFSRLKTERQLGLDSVELVPPTFTHSQPGTIKLKVLEKGSLPTVGFMDMFRAAGTGAHLREAVLKRPDEHDLVERIHRRPQFAEDVVRAVSMELAAYADADLTITVSADLDESIHPHRAHAECTGFASDFWRGA